MSDPLLDARPLTLRHDAPTANKPDDPLAWLEIYLTTGLGGSVVVEREPDATPPADCPECGNTDTETVRVRRSGISVDTSGRTEWYCPACGAIESDLPLWTGTRWSAQPAHATLTVLAAMLWLVVIPALAIVVGLARLADWTQRRWPAP